LEDPNWTAHACSVCRRLSVCSCLTRSAAITEGPRDVLCQLNRVHSCISEKACVMWMTLKVTQGYRNCLYSIGLISSIHSLSPHGVCGDMSFNTVLFGRHAVNDIDEIWQYISRIGVSERDDIWHVDRGGLAVHQGQDWCELWPSGLRSPWAPKYWSVKNGNAIF